MSDDARDHSDGPTDDERAMDQHRAAEEAAACDPGLIIGDLQAALAVAKARIAALEAIEEKALAVRAQWTSTHTIKTDLDRAVVELILALSGEAGAGCNYDLIPPACQDGLIRHILFGDELGDFLEAVLRGDLMEVAARADHENGPLIRLYCSFLFNVAPRPCFGSKAEVAAWRADRASTGPFPVGGVDWPNDAWRTQANAVMAARAGAA